MTLQKQIWEKVARNQTLLPAEEMEFINFAEKLQTAESLLGSWTKAGGQTAKLDYPKLSSPSWIGSPLHFFSAQQIANVSVPNNTNTYITFDTSKNFGGAFRLSEDGTRVIWDSLDNRAFAIHGYATWTGNATGYRGAWLEGFDKNDVSIGSSALHTFAGNNLVDNVLPISFEWYLNGFAYLKFYVLQTSGGALTLKDFLLGFSLR